MHRWMQRVWSLVLFRDRMVSLQSFSSKSQRPKKLKTIFAARKLELAGFHEHDDWPGVPGGSQDADYFEAIGSCMQAADKESRLRLISEDR